jgi:hypothetical protein
LVSFVSIGWGVVAGASLIVGQGRGLYLVIPAVRVILLVASYFAWTRCSSLNGGNRSQIDRELSEVWSLLACDKRLPLRV